MTMSKKNIFEQNMFLSLWTFLEIEISSFFLLDIFFRNKFEIYFSKTQTQCIARITKSLNLGLV